MSNKRARTGMDILSNRAHGAFGACPPSSPQQAVKTRREDNAADGEETTWGALLRKLSLKVE
jgi:hypothetical protein